MADRKMTLKERADRWVNKNARFGGEDDADEGFVAGWHARGRADRLTKAERAVVEAAQEYANAVRNCDPRQSLNPLGMAVAKLERARRKA